MKKKVLSRIISGALTLCLACASIVCMPAASASAASASPVQLNYAQANICDGVYLYQGDISVQNLAYNKQVSIHYTLDDQTWQDCAATYAKDDQNNPGYEVWSFNLASNGAAIGKFEVKYVVNGTTYYDNNNGNYYYFGRDVVLLGKDVVKVAFGETYSGIFVQNLGYTKEVGVRYSTDNWATYKDVDATYTGSENSNVDAFSFPTVPSGAQYVVYYKVNGVTYWDNNYGANYLR